MADISELYKKYLGSLNSGSPDDYTEAAKKEQDLSIPNTPSSPQYSMENDLLLKRILSDQPSLFNRVSDKYNDTVASQPDMAALSAGESVDSSTNAENAAPKTTAMPIGKSPSTLPPSPAVASNTEPYGSELNDAAIKSAQDQNRQGLLLKGLLQGSALVGAGIGRSQINPEFNQGLETIGELGKLPLQNIQERRKGLEQESAREKQLIDLTNTKSMNDPNSNESKVLSEYVKQHLGLNVDGMSAAKIKDSLDIKPGTLAGIEKEANAKIEAARIGAQSRVDINSTKAGSKNDADFEKFGKAINPYTAPQRSALGKLGVKANQIERAKTLINTVKDPNTLSEQQYHETVATLDNILSEGSSVYGREQLAAPSSAGRISNYIQFMTNRPASANRGEFFKQIDHTLDREAGTFQNQLEKIINSSGGAYAHLKKADPERYQQTVQDVANNLFTKQYNQQLGAKTPTAPLSPTAPKASDMTGGLVRMQAPDGTIRMVPQDKVDAAVAARGIILPPNGNTQ